MFFQEKEKPSASHRGPLRALLGTARKGRISGGLLRVSADQTEQEGAGQGAAGPREAARSPCAGVSFGLGQRARAPQVRGVVQKSTDFLQRSFKGKLA